MNKHQFVQNVAAQFVLEPEDLTTSPISYPHFITFQSHFFHTCLAPHYLCKPLVVSSQILTLSYQTVCKKQYTIIGSVRILIIHLSYANRPYYPTLWYLIIQSKPPNKQKKRFLSCNCKISTYWVFGCRPLLVPRILRTTEGGRAFPLALPFWSHG